MKQRLHELYPETATARVIYQRVLHRNDCPLFQPRAHALRPAVSTPQPGLVLAGDGIRIDLPVALMERAATTGWSAANRLLAQWGLAGHPLQTVPNRGRSALLRALATRAGAAAMSIGDHVRQRWPKNFPLQVISSKPWESRCPSYRDAQPAIIDAALNRAQQRPTGNWFVFAASRDIRADRPYGTRVAGVELVAWRDRQQRLCVGPRSCPHLGADLATGDVHRGVLICRWHGLMLDGNQCDLGWTPLPSHDDGVLVWVRLDDAGGETPSDEPIIAGRPGGPHLHAVTRMVGICQPCDIIANRLDPGTARGFTRIRLPNFRCWRRPQNRPTGFWWR